MITLATNNFDLISQESYNDIIFSLNFDDLTCTCGHCACLIRHGSYERTVKSPNGKFRLRVFRVKCNICGCTHALLLSSIVPYSQISLKDQVTIINCYEEKNGFQQVLNTNDSIDENNIYAVIRNYCKYWKQELILKHIVLSSLFKLVKQCFFIFAQQFMQMKNTRNLLYHITLLEIIFYILYINKKAKIDSRYWTAEKMKKEKLR